MIASMTGFARREARTAHGVLTWELKAVNGRYLDLGWRLPEEFRVLEPALRETAAARLARGKLEASLRFEPLPETEPALVLNEALLRAVLAAAAHIKVHAPDARALSVADLLRWPGMLVTQEPDPGPLLDAARALFEAALDELVAARRREGERLAQALTERARALAARVAEVRARLPEVRARGRERLEARLAELAGSADPARLAQELALLAQRLDVDEELDRLTSHLAELEDALARDEPVGRRLDFLMQELNREANTLASKSQDTQTTRAAVEMKVLIEQMREQVQNVE
ncbi:MAG TPA: YicC/YloC family endoribonuclease [Gammaproteobacteria bacterium]|nr:YicC/YloC family endoribonuclease [Gammaproteobacteria bacterium]